jgi:hypothetical protein
VGERVLGPVADIRGAEACLDAVPLGRGEVAGQQRGRRQAACARRRHERQPGIVSGGVGLHERVGGGG